MKGVKKASVCKGCKYLINHHTYSSFNNTCDYMTQTGQSRLKIEMKNGGFKTDSCVCYEKKQGRGRRKAEVTE